jgi:hypothetical protein
VPQARRAVSRRPGGSDAPAEPRPTCARRPFRAASGSVTGAKTFR